jgi:hypothetical protein
MKRFLTILLVVTLVCSISFAQNTSTVNQTGNNHQATVSQSGTGNDSTLNQTKTDYTYYSSATRATINQTGTDNTSIVNELRGAYGGNANWSEVTVNQSGTDNMSNVYQNVNDYAHATVTQDGIENEADIDQIGNTSYATIYQQGELNYGKQYLWTINSTADIIQVGSSNQAYQTTLTPPVKNSVFYIEQRGDRNYAQQDIKGTAWGYAQGGNNATIYQTGNDNNATQFMGGSPSGSDYNTSTISQTGNDNDATSSQDGTFNTDTITQLGNSNLASLTQTGTGHLGTINQIGDGNAATVTQGP